MTFTKTIERLQLLHELISQNKTGTPEQLANRLGVSRSYLYVMIDELRLLNLHISYSRKNKSFYYEKVVDVEFVLKIRTLNEDDLININAGSCISFFPTSILDGTSLSLHSYLREYKESAHRL
jgi:predicted DNA-binding transcriptional regulator YafY